ncbi:MAG: antitoxin [Thiocapsa sp.]|jgi:hypothetical protein|nr:antitoxin [Thiocapsa sp.]MCG6896899.1 antitoxin [Thiocapsa sp.]MCG6985523.1 antitoxin [Thiocapsa sp.]
MPPNIALLRADIEDELAKLEQLAQVFATAREKLDLPPAEISVYDRGAIGYLLHNFYNGCENMFRRIAAFFENDVGTDTWHADLLRRMKLRVEGYRPAVIDDELYRLLQDFRGFRHVFRNAYSFELDWERERLVALRFETTLGLLRQQVKAFLASLDALE